VSLLPLLLAQAAAACPAGTAHPVVVRVAGLRDRSGQLRVRLFGDPPASYFDKRRVLVRVEVPTPAAGQVDVCVAAPRPGLYAADVRHDVNGDGRTDRRDGGGASGNPRLTLWDVVFARKPRPATVQFRVGAGGATVPITVLYLQGTTFRPAAGAR